MIGEFHYEGQLEATKQPGCRVCISATSGMCLALGSDPNHHSATCGLCAAVTKKRCDTHGRGLKVAIDEGKMVSPDAQKTFDALKPVILAALTSVPASATVSVRVTLSDTGGKPSEHGEHPREVLVHVKQLDLG